MTTPPTTTKKTPLRIGMFGGGTVGGGVYELLQNSNDDIAAACAVVTHICVRDIHKKRDFVVDSTTTTITNNPKDILENPDIDCVVEVMGGTTLAKTVVLQALAAGKSVVTANKALLAEHLDEISKAVVASNKPLVYEAAVCGGIPIIHLLQSSYTADKISSVAGICNGTTNYMLCAMEQGADYDEILKKAQDLGYAEADPAADVEGWDVRAKICLLSQLAFGQTVAVQDIPCQGITGVDAVDFEYAGMLKATIKLVGTASVTNDKLAVYVTPVMVSRTNLLATARGSGNAVAVTSSNLGTCAYTGPGAGRFPTANSVVADIYRVASHQTPPWTPTTSTSTTATTTLREVDLDYSAKFYIRIPYSDSLGIIKSVGTLAEQHGVSIHSILQNPIAAKAAATTHFCVTTNEAKRSAVTALCLDIAQQDYAKGAPLAMPLILE